MTLERLAPWMIVAVTITSLAFAMTAEHIYLLEPCILCLYQRIPFVATGLLALLALKLPAASPSIPTIIGLCALIYLGGAGVAVYHVGVEQHWWVSGCTGASAGELSFDLMKSALNSKPEKSCDDIDWTLFGISMATYNVAFSTAMGMVALLAAHRIRKSHEPKKDQSIETPAG